MPSRYNFKAEVTSASAWSQRLRFVGLKAVS